MEGNYTELPSRYAPNHIVWKLRDHVGVAYRVAEKLPWIEAGVETEYLSIDKDLDLHPEDELLQEETGAKIGMHPPQRIIVAPVLSVHFQGEPESVEDARADVWAAVETTAGIEIDEIYVDAEREILGVRFSPFVINVAEQSSGVEE